EVLGGTGAERPSGHPGRFSLPGENPLCQGHVLPAADEERSALVQLRRLDVQDALPPIRRGSASLLRDERQRARLIQKPELAVGRLSIARIAEDPATQSIAVEVGDERADVTGVHRLAGA